MLSYMYLLANVSQYCIANTLTANTNSPFSSADDDDDEAEEALKPKLTFNPYLQRLYQVIPIHVHFLKIIIVYKYMLIANLKSLQL